MFVLIIFNGVDILQIQAIIRTITTIGISIVHSEDSLENSEYIAINDIITNIIKHKIWGKESCKKFNVAGIALIIVEDKITKEIYTK